MDMSNPLEFPPSIYVREMAAMVRNGDIDGADDLLAEQIAKVREEIDELCWALDDADKLEGEDRIAEMAHAAEEAADVCQAAMQAMRMVCVYAGVDAGEMAMYVRLKCLARDKMFYGNLG